MAFDLRAMIETLNQWHAANPLVFGLIPLLLGLIIVGSAVYSLLIGKARARGGVIVEGGRARLLAGAQLLLGLAILALAVNKLLSI